MVTRPVVQRDILISRILSCIIVIEVLFFIVLSERQKKKTFILLVLCLQPPAKTEALLDLPDV